MRLIVFIVFCTTVGHDSSPPLKERGLLCPTPRRYNRRKAQPVMDSRATESRREMGEVVALAKEKGIHPGWIFPRS